MTWFRVDDSYYDHPKVFDAPDCAVALWTRAGCWSARNLTDGYVPASLPARLCDDPERAVRELTQRGLWTRVKGGYRFHDWGDYQPLRADVEADRAAARERMRRVRANRKTAGQVAKRSPEHRANFGRSSATPTRPDPEPHQGVPGSGVNPDPTAAHAYRPAPGGECAYVDPSTGAECGLPAANRRHIRLVAS